MCVNCITLSEKNKNVEFEIGEHFIRYINTKLINPSYIFDLDFEYSDIIDYDVIFK